MWISDWFRPGRALEQPPQPATRAANVILAALICYLAPGTALAAGRLYQVREIKPRVFVWTPDDVIEAEGDPQYTRAGTAGFIITDQGVVVIDTTNSPFHARELLYEIRQRTQQPVWYVINTGGSGDEMLGNEVFGDLQAAILSTPEIQNTIRDRAQASAARQRSDPEFQRRMRGIHVTPPSRTFEHQMELPVTPSIKLIAFDPKVKSLAVYLPELRVAFLGDLFQNEYFPRLEGRGIHGWIEALRQAEAWDADVYVPGHGEPAGKSQVQQFRQFLEWLTNEVQTRLREGKSLERVQLELLPFKSYSWHAPEQAAGLLADLYQELKEDAGRQDAGDSASSPARQ